MRRKEWDKRLLQKLCGSLYARMIMVGSGQIPIPYGLFDEIHECLSIHKEAVLSYLIALPGASMERSLRCLGLALQRKYALIEGRDHSGEIMDLIDWAEQYVISQGGGRHLAEFEDLIDWAEQDIGASIQLPYTFKILRDGIRSASPDIPLEDTSAKTLVHVSLLCNALFPFTQHEHGFICELDRSRFQIAVPATELWLHNYYKFRCKCCNRHHSQYIMYDIDDLLGRGAARRIHVLIERKFY